MKKRLKFVRGIKMHFDIKTLLKYFNIAIKRFNKYFNINIPIIAIVDPKNIDYNDAYTIIDDRGNYLVTIGFGICTGRNPVANLVAIIAHEYGHVVANHYKRNINFNNAEFEADAIAVRALFENDCDPYSLCDCLVDIAHNHCYTIYNDNIGGHPTSFKRIKRMKKLIRAMK